jgi:putative PIG3 family NAD(P)H quinone oxidoreductase
MYIPASESIRYVSVSPPWSGAASTGARLHPPSPANTPTSPTIPKNLIPTFDRIEHVLLSCLPSTRARRWRRRWSGDARARAVQRGRVPTVDAVHVTRPGGPEVLAIAPLAIDAPGPGEVLVEVAAAGLNRADLLQRRGLYGAPPGVPADVLGLEFAGIVAALGPGVDGWRVGDRVMGIVGGGAMARLVRTRADALLAVPPALSLVEAAAVPEAFLTAHDALFTQGLLDAGQVVLVHAAASGVGTAALQLARRRGARALATTRTPAKAERLRGELGAITLDPAAPSAWRATLDAHGLPGVDVVLDPLGASTFAPTLALARPGARWILIGVMGGARVEVPLGEVLTRRLVLRGTTLRSRADAERAAVTAAFARDCGDALAQGALRPIVDATWPMRAVADAHARMEANESFGKLVLTW